MTKIRFFPTLILIAVFLSACAPAAPVSPAASGDETSPTLSPSLDDPTAQPLAPSPLPIATSRGPELHASDPTAVDLASGGLQLVEFFRFT